MKKYFVAILIAAIVILSTYIYHRFQLSEIATKLASDKPVERNQGYRDSMALDQAGRDILLKELEIDPAFQAQLLMWFNLHKPGSKMYQYS
jgi:hypothetical protein